MRHSATSRHRGGQWQYWGNCGRCCEPHANNEGNGKGCQKKMVGMLDEIPKDIEGHWRGDRRCQKDDER